MPNGIVQAKLLGGFGNQLHQYAAARAYAESIGAQLEVPDWPGRAIFGLTEPVYSCALPNVNVGDDPELAQGKTNICLGGYFQTQPWIDLLSRAELKRWLRPAGIFADVRHLPKPPYTAAHLRRGDYVGHPLFACVSRESYARACDQFGVAIDVWADQERPLRIAGWPDFLPDFLVLLRAAVILRANSTFSWWAAALSDARVYAPVVEDRVGRVDVNFAYGNWPRCADTSRVGVRIDDLRLPD